MMSFNYTSLVRQCEPQITAILLIAIKSKTMFMHDACSFAFEETESVTVRAVKLPFLFAVIRSQQVHNLEDGRLLGCCVV
jgi:hypothetical protein